MLSIFRDDDLGKVVTALFQSATTTRTDRNYSSNIKSFFNLCDMSLLDFLTVSLIDIVRYDA